MNKNKKIIMSAIALSVALGGGAVFGAQSIYAKSGGMGSDGQHESFITKFAEKFNISEDEITAVFDEVRQEEMNEHHAQRELELSDAVTNSELTEAQKQLILDKNEEMHTERESNRDSIRNLSREDRQTKLDEDRGALELWAEENGIDIKYLTFGDGRYGEHGGKNNMNVQN